MKRITCTCGRGSFVDDEDYEKISQPWHCNGRGSRRISRLLLNTELEVDHRDRDDHNNQKSNLRPATDSQNACNRGPHANGTSGYKGVSFDISKGTKKRYRMHIMKDGKNYTSSHETALEAALTYDKKARKLHGEFAYQNFIIS